MAAFSYAARDKAGARVAGTLEAPDRMQALRQLEHMGLFPFSLTSTSPAKPKPTPAPGLPSMRSLPKRSRYPFLSTAAISAVALLLTATAVTGLRHIIRLAPAETLTPDTLPQSAGAQDVSYADVYAETPTSDTLVQAAANQTAEVLLQRADFIASCNGQIKNEYLCFVHNRVCSRTLEVESADAADLAYGKEVVSRALSRYPVRVITANVDRIYILRQLKKRQDEASVPLAGTVGLRSIYLSTKECGCEDGIFHHELCHLLLCAYRKTFPEEAWRKCNPETFSYKRSSESTSSYPVSNYLDDGFICSYGRAACMEDVSTYAELLFTRPEWLLEQASKYPRVRAKTDLLIEFYGQIDPVFSLEYFCTNAPLRSPPSGPQL